MTLIDVFLEALRRIQDRTRWDRDLRSPPLSTIHGVTRSPLYGRSAALWHLLSVTGYDTEGRALYRGAEALYGRSLRDSRFAGCDERGDRVWLASPTRLAEIEALERALLSRIAPRDPREPPMPIVLPFRRRRGRLTPRTVAALEALRGLGCSDG